MAVLLLQWPYLWGYELIMADKQIRKQILAVFPQDDTSLSIHEIQSLVPEKVAERTLRRWLVDEVKKGRLLRSGQKRSTRYQLNLKRTPQTKFAFLEGITESKQAAILKQLRDLWTHSSTALEGNTLTLGDTHFVLEEGITISGKPLKDHQEVMGHAGAIEILYQSLSEPVTPELCFALHKAVQTEIIYDIDKPYGAWKNRPNGTYTVAADDSPIYLEYALPQHVPALMNEVIDALNAISIDEVDLGNAHRLYAKFHAAIAHIHPFWDGNGRMARLLANVPLLKSGLPPIVIPAETRREYIQLLAAYERGVGQLDHKSGAWPLPHQLKEFEGFCLDCYQETRQIVSGS
jgi:Fic family protein